MKLYGVTVTNTERAGIRYRVLVSVAGRGTVYGGSFTEPYEAGVTADTFRFWLHQKGVVPRPPRLNNPKLFSDPDKVPKCPEKVEKLAGTLIEEDIQRKKAGGSYADLLLTVATLVDRVTALENRSKADPTKTVGPKAL